MSIDVVLTQKGFFKKPMPLEVILGKELAYGEMEGFRLIRGQLGKTEFLAYHPAHIARGFSVIWSPEEKERIQLRALMPSTEAELRDFYDAVDRMASYWKCRLEVDGSPMNAAQFQASFSEMASFQQWALQDMCRKILSVENDDLTLFSAMWPLVVGKEEAYRFLETPETFEPWLHEKQSIDAYYAAPRFFRGPAGILGRYVLTEGVRSIFPTQPSVPFGAIDPETNQKPVCDDFAIALYSTTRDTVLGEIPYERLLQKLPPEKVSRFDGGNVLLEPLSLSEMEALLDN